MTVWILADKHISGISAIEHVYATEHMAIDDLNIIEPDPDRQYKFYVIEEFEVFT